MKSDKLLRRLHKAGWKEVRQKGSHKILRKEGNSSILVFPYHKGKEIPTGTYHRILKQAGLK